MGKGIREKGKGNREMDLPSLLLKSKILANLNTSGFSLSRLPSKVLFYLRLSSTKGCLPSMIVFHQRSSSIKGFLLSRVVFHRRLSSNKGLLPSKVVIHQRLSSIEGHLPLKIIFFFWIIFIFGFLS